MYYIIGDIGNTTTRICLLNKSKIVKSIIIDTNKLLLKNYLIKILNKENKKNLKSEVLFSCVVPSVLSKIKKSLKKTK